MGTWTRRAAAAAAVVVVGSYLGAGDGPERMTAPSAEVTAVPAAPTTPAPPGAPAAPAAPTTPAAPVAPVGSGPDRLMPADGGDGDSWRDTAGREYRLGMVNAPELDECFGAEATAERTALVARGFSAAVYAQDRYGRSVSVVTTSDGRDVNVHLARYGFADDRYLEQFRHENPQLAQRLDAAFAAARAERRGLWAACARQPPDR